ncbi:MAG: chemotaxis protein CheW [Cyanothece sp. SIO1E1]|nr:chemotaxis protein CheW [Cyanothece sp. SIO1E1]
MLNHDVSVGKFIVFRILDYFLALPLEDVLKVVKCSPQDSQEMSKMGILVLESHTMRVFDLQQQLNSKHPPEEQLFLLITRSAQGDPCGILLAEPPNLAEIPPEMMRSLPHSQSGFLDLFSHAAVISQEKGKKTVFLLDVQKISTNALNSAIHTSQTYALKSLSATANN